MCKEALHQAGTSVKLTMTCDDCAESENGKPAQACCPQCLDEHRAALLESGHGVEYSTGKRRYYIDEATALADHLELAGALSLLKDSRAREARLQSEALDSKKQIGRLSKRSSRLIEMMHNRYLMCAKLAELLKKSQEVYAVFDDYYVYEQDQEKISQHIAAVESALKEWEDGK